MSTLPLEGTRTHRAPASAAASRWWAARTPVLVVWDALITLALFALTAPIAGSPIFDERLHADGVGAFGVAGLVLAAVAPLGIAMAGGYDRRGNIFGVGRITRFLGVSGACAMVAMTVSGVAGTPLDLGQAAAVALALPLAWIAGRRAGERQLRRDPERVLIVGSGTMARHIANLALRHPERGLSVVGCVDDQAVTVEGIDPPLLGRMADLRRVLREERIDRVIVSFSLTSDLEIAGIIRECDSSGIEVNVVPRLHDVLGARPIVESLGGLALLSVRPKVRSTVQRAAKRAVDITVSGTLLALSAPIMLAVAIAIRIDDGKPVLFRQTRIGRGGRQFDIVKFRTMIQGADRQQASELIDQGPDAIAAIAETMKRESNAWITPVGAFLRRTSLDELPQLWNVLKGDMSLVGPRPLRQYEVEALSDWEIARQEVRPGITGLWQILGRSDIHWNERMQLDYSYVRHWSFRTDMVILARTAGVVIARRGAV